MNEKYGIVLELITNKFEAQMQKVKNTMSKTSKEIQDKATVSPTFGDVAKKYKDVNKAIEEFNKVSINQKASLKSLEEIPKVADKVNNSFDKMKKNTISIGDNIKKGFGNGIKTIKKFALALFGIRGIYRLVTKASNAYLATNEELSNKIQGAWTSLGAILSPIIEYLANMLVKLIGLINQVITALFGVNLVAKATAKSVKGVGGSANKALAGFDTIRNLNDSSGGGAGSPLAGLNDKAFEKISDRFKKVFDVFQKAWKSKGERVITSIKTAFTNLKQLGNDVGKSIYEVWTNGTGQKILEAIIEKWALVFDIIGGIADAIDKAWTKNNVGTSIIQHIANIYLNLEQIVINIGEQLKKWVLSKNFQKATENTFKVLDDVFEIIEDISKWVKDMWDKYFSETFYKLLDTLTSVYNAIVAIWDYIKPFVTKVIDKLQKDLEPVIKGLTDIINGVLDAIKGIADFITNVFEGNWNKAWEGMKDTFKRVWADIGISEDSTVGKALNWVLETIGKIGNAISNLNGKNATVKVNADTSNFKSKMSKFTTETGKSVVKSILGIPFGPFSAWINSLDVGTNYVPNDQLAMIHKGEMIVPKKYNPATSNIGTGNDETNRLLNRLIVTLEEKDMNAYISSNDVGRASVSYINEQSRIMGRKLI